MIERLEPDTVVRGTLHVEVAYDWGDEVDLNAARSLASGREQDLERRARTPTSVAYRPAPLRFSLPAVEVELPSAGMCPAVAEATLFDFGAANIRLDIPFAVTADCLRSIAGDPRLLQSFVQAARRTAEPLFQELRPSISQPHWRDFSEEYFIFRFDPSSLPSPDRLLRDHSDWLAGLLGLEKNPLSRDEIADALDRRLTYTPDDLVLADWAAAIVIDSDCEETLRAIEFANVQLLEFRYVDRRLDDALKQAYGLIHSLADSRRIWSWRSHHKPLRVLGDIKIETEMLFERAGSALKLVGDQYLARLYRLMADRFHLDEWGASIRQSLDVVESVYQILSDQAGASRIELLEIIVIFLIAVEIVISLSGLH